MDPAYQQPAQPLGSIETAMPKDPYMQQTYRNFVACDYPTRRGNIRISYLADWFIVLCILVGCAIFFANPPGRKWFRLDDPDLSYPDYDDVVFPSWLLHVLYWIPPLIIMSLAQIWLRNFPEWHHTLLSFVETIAMTYFVTTFLMWSVGRLRPSWLQACKPGVPFQAGPPYTYYTDDVCTADWSDIRSHQQSFPSGHAATIFGSYTWLMFYLNAKLKVFDGNAHAWKLITFLPLLFAVWISFSRVNDAKHFYFDVCAGIVLGIAIAVIGWRMNFCSFFGPDNHIPMRLLWTEATFTVKAPPHILEPQRHYGFRQGHVHTMDPSPIYPNNNTAYPNYVNQQPGMQMAPPQVPPNGIPQQ